MVSALNFCRSTVRLGEPSFFGATIIVERQVVGRTLWYMFDTTQCHVLVDGLFDTSLPIVWNRDLIVDS